jgi:hypothetical protein
MQENNQFEYAVIRIVPKVEREEFLNVGVVLYCAKQQFLQMKFHLDKERLQAFNCDMSVEEITAYLNAFEQICLGDLNAGPIAKLPIAGRFRWLTATRSTVVQTSKVHPGLCLDAGEMLTKIYQQQVL